MQVTLRLAKLLRYDEHKSRGLIQEICDKTGLKRYQVADMIHNKVQYLSLDSVGKICQFLVDQRYAKASQLPGELFGRVPEGFWPLLIDRERVEFCIGARRVPEWRDDLVSAADAELQARLVNVITGPDDHGVKRGAGRVLDPHLVTAPDLEGRNLASIQQQAKGVYHKFAAEEDDKAIVLLGSIKSNPVCELAVARAFVGAEEFVGQDHVDDARQRNCPFYMIYRPHDPHPPSCFGGRTLSRSDPRDEPGIYYEDPDGKWQCCPWTDATDDAAMVFYRHQKSRARVDMVLGGYSGRATRSLARCLRAEADHLWPPSYESDDLAVGAFIFRLTYDKPDARPGKGPPHHQAPKDVKVIRLKGDGFVRRLLPAAARRPRSK
jgi:hypothetical protein